MVTFFRCVLFGFNLKHLIEQISFAGSKKKRIFVSKQINKFNAE